MILPAHVNLVAQALVADVRGETHATVRILVRGRGVNHVGAVKHHVASFVIGEEQVRDKAFGVVSGFCFHRDVLLTPRAGHD